MPDTTVIYNNDIMSVNPGNEFKHPRAVLS
jgi:hypothetical protein